MWEPCSEGCPGYAAFHVDRRPLEGLEYVSSKGEVLELEACNACGRFFSDDLAYAQWIADGRPSLDKIPEPVEVRTQGANESIEARDPISVLMHVSTTEMSIVMDALSQYVENTSGENRRLTDARRLEAAVIQTFVKITGG